MSRASLWTRWRTGRHWSWISDAYRDRIPADIDAQAMSWPALDRFHAKQGRSTCRVRFDSNAGPLTAYLKRHERLPWPTRIAALANPSALHSPAGTEWRRLEQARQIGVPVPDVVAAGEHLGPRATLQSYLIVAELVGHDELNLAIPRLKQTLSPAHFAQAKQSITRELVALVARLHRARSFHKDLYLCHVFVDLARIEADPTDVRLVLIDLHRLQRHPWTALRWQVKDLGQLLFSTFGVDGITARDRLRFWRGYVKALPVAWPRTLAALLRWKAARYLDHNERGGQP